MVFAVVNTMIEEKEKNNNKESIVQP